MSEVVEKFQFKLLLTQLDHEKLPVVKAREVLLILYNSPIFLPSVLKNIAKGLYMAVRHIEAVCVTALKRAGELDRKLKKEAAAILLGKESAAIRMRELSAKESTLHSLSIFMQPGR